MKKTNHIVEELIIISPLIGQIERTQVYSVPATYFNDLSVEIIKKISNSKQRAFYLGSSVPYDIPADYFKNLPELILQKVLTHPGKSNDIFEEMEDLAPLLNTISKKPVYSVPSNFFETIQIQSPPVTSQDRKAPLVSIKKRSKFLRFGVAAVIIPFLAIGLYTLIVKDPESINRSNTKNAVKNLSDEEIVAFLKNNVPTQSATSASPRTSNTDHEIKSSLKQVSDKEIYQFLKETAEFDEI